MRFLAGAALLVACVCATVWVIVAVFSGGADCRRRGGHMQTTSWVWTGKTLVPIDACVGAHP